MKRERKRKREKEKKRKRKRCKDETVVVDDYLPTMANESGNKVEMGMKRKKKRKIEKVEGKEMSREGGGGRWLIEVVGRPTQC